MPIRFSTEAANADFMREDAEPGAAPEAVTGARRERPSGSRGDKQAEARDGEAKPGKDINAAGFIKDKDAGTPRD